MKLNIIGNRKWFIGFSALLITLSIASIAIFGFTPGIDFKSGTMWQVSIPGTDERAVREFAETKLGIEEPVVSYDASTESYSLIFKEISEEEHAAFKNSLLSEYPEARELDFGTTSPSVSSELRNKAIWIIALVVLVIALYVTFTFRKVSWPVKSYKYGLVTLASLVHDVLVPAGFFAALGHFKGIPIDTYFIVALLTIAGFSVQDTIVIFDRIREKLIGQKGKADFDETANRSINEVFTRSLITATGAMIALLIVSIFGPVSMRYFALTILIGMFFGTYSSIFFASPLLTLWHDLQAKRAARKTAK
ncbi:MAG: protein translocase subunit SecF [Parcubacteria group bacterium]